MTLELHNYRVEVYDPEQARRVSFEFRAANEGAADIEARFGYTGLLGGEAAERTRDQLEVEVFLLD